MVQILHAVEVIEVQEHNLSGMSRQEATDLFQTRSHLNNTQTRNQRWKMGVDKVTTDPYYYCRGILQLVSKQIECTVVKTS